MAVIRVGNTPDLLVGTGADGALEAKTAEAVRAAIGAAPALQADVTIYVSPTGSDAEGDGSQAAPYATIQRAVDSVPKYLNAHTATINIADGEYDEAVNIVGYTAGMLSLHGGTVNGTIIRNIAISYSGIVQIDKCTLKQIGAEGVQNGAMLYIIRGSTVMLGDVTIYCSASCFGLQASYSTIGSYKISALTINDVNYEGGSCILATHSARLDLCKIAGNNATDRTLGISSECGSTIAYQENTLTAGTMYRTLYGGRIYAGGQTSIPNY